MTLAVVLGSQATALADGGTCTVTVTRDLPTGDNAGVDDVPISSLEGAPDETVDVSALFEAEHECEHFCPEAILEKETVEWSVVSATLAPFVIPPAAQPQPVDVAAKFKVDPVAGDNTTLKGTAPDQIGDYTVTIKAKAKCEWNVNGKQETAEDEDTITVVFHVYTVFLGLYNADFKQDDDFVMLKDDVGEKKGGKVDKHVGLFPFQVFGHATVLGAPEVLPVKTSIADPGGHYSLVGAAAGKPVDVPKFPAWFGYWVRGDKLSDKLDDGLQVGTFFGKTSKDKGTVFSAVGSLTFPQPFGTYITGRDSEEELINVAGWRTTGDVGFRIRVSAKLTPDSPVLCASPQAKSCQVGYVQNVNAASRDVRYLPNLDSKEFHPDLRNGTTLNVPDYIDSTLPFPTPLRDHKKDHDTYNDFLLQPPLNCGGSPFDIDDTPPSSALLTITKTFPPPPAIDPAPPFGLLLRYDLASHKRTLDFYGWCVIYVARGTGVVPLQQVRIGLTLDSSLDESKAIVLEDPAVAKNPPITDGETANAYARRVGYVEVLGDANTVVEKEP